MSVSLQVASLTNGSLAFTNRACFTSTARIGAYVKLNNSILNTRDDPALPQGSIGLNSLQRAACSVGQGETVDVTPYTARSEDAAHIIRFEIDLLISKKRVEMKEEAVVDKIRKVFDNNFIVCRDMVYCLDVNDTPIKITCKEIKCIDSASQDGDIEYRIAQYGLLTNTTDFILETDQKNPNRLFTFIQNESKKRPVIFDSNWRFEDMGIGGLDKEFSTIFRRSFASRLLPPKFVERLGIKHVKGMLLYGPPGTGKTLIARQIGKMLGGNEPKIVNGPEILNKFVGQAEENIRNLFADAITDYNENKENAGLHVIIFDEIDAICKARGSVRSGTGVHDTVVNQLLTMIDGINTPNNILVIGMTNRKDMLDPALLRPGRLEVHVEISLPDKPGRVQILKIHTKTMKENGILADDFDIDYLAAHTKNFSGAELEGLVKSATSYAVASAVDVKNISLKDNYENMKVTQQHFVMSLDEVKASFGVDEEDIKSLITTPIIEYSDDFNHMVAKIKDLITSLHNDPNRSTATVLLKGEDGSGKTALAAKLALESGFPFVKLVAPHNYIGLAEGAKASEMASVFDQAYKSPLSVVLVDNIESLLEYVPIGPRFSNVMLQTFMTLFTRPHPKPDRKLLILVTTSKYHVIRQMQMRSAFNFTVEVPTLTAAADYQAVFDYLNIPQTSETQLIIKEEIPEIGIKQLLLVLTMATQPQRNRSGESVKVPLTREIFREWLINCGVGTKSDDGDVENF